MKVSWMGKNTGTEIVPIQVTWERERTEMTFSRISHSCPIHIRNRKKTMLSRQPTRFGSSARKCDLAHQETKYWEKPKKNPSRIIVACHFCGTKLTANATEHFRRPEWSTHSHSFHIWNRMDQSGTLGYWGLFRSIGCWRIPRVSPLTFLFCFGPWLHLNI